MSKLNFYKNVKTDITSIVEVNISIIYDFLLLLPVDLSTFVNTPASNS